MEPRSEEATDVVGTVLVVLEMGVAEVECLRRFLR
jgi:hypothetical protein